MKISKINSKVLAVIPARKGSKRIVNKNIKKFNNVPIIAYSIKAAKKSKVFDYISVSTDCKKIAKIAKKYGANIDFVRPKKISNDKAKTLEVIKHSIKFYENMGKKFDYICCLYPSSPFINPNNIKISLKRLKKQKTNFIFVVQEYSSPIQRALTVENKKVKWVNKIYSSKNSNKLKKSYFDSGQFYFGTKKKFLSKGNLIDNKTDVIILEKHTSIDINDTRDWAFAEKILKIR